MKLIDFFERFPDEHSCKDAWREQRQKSDIVCRKCKGQNHYWMVSIEQFHCKTCGTRTTLRSGTVMESSNLPIRDWFLTMHLMTSTKKGFSAKEIQRQLGYKRYEPVWYMMQKVRVAMSCRDERYDLAGTLEMDEGFFASVKQDQNGQDGKPLKRGRGSEKQSPVLVIAETAKGTKTRKGRPSRSCKYFKMKVMSDQSSDTINQITEQNIHAEAKVVTDNFSSYKRLNEEVKRHVAKTIPPAQAGKELPWVHIAISNAKRNLLNNFHHVSDTYLQNYLDEFTYKLNRRYFGEGIFARLVIACICFSWTLC